MPVEPSDDEEAYFKALDIEQRKTLREKLDTQAKELAEQQQIAASVQTSDLSAAEKVKALGFDGDSARVFDLLPLVHVAWADGKIQKAERASILHLLDKRGIERDSEAFRTIESLLEEKPSDEYMAQSLAVLREITGGISDRSEEIVDLCIQVAAASGGFLGLGKKIGEEEKALIAEILTALGPYAADQFKRGLSQ
jgi:tellurite resistance protein